MQVSFQSLSDLKYSISVLRQLLSYHSCQTINQDSVISYYYQYEMDSSKTMYEYLMHDHIISIASKSYQDAMMINLCARCIVDGHCGTLLNYIEKDCSLEQLYNNIITSDELSEYDGYMSSTYKPIRKECYPAYEQYVDVLNLKRKRKPYTFTIAKCSKILNKTNIAWLLNLPTGRRLENIVKEI
jgi:hypothetical protein